MGKRTDLVLERTEVEGRMDTGDPVFLSLGEAAQVAGVDPRTMKKFIDEGKVPAFCYTEGKKTVYRINKAVMIKVLSGLE